MSDADATAMTALLDERSAALAKRGRTRERAAAMQAYLVCRAGGERVGLRLTEVASVLAVPPCTPLPNAPRAIRGIVALSGTIVTVLDLGLALGLEGGDGEADASSHLVRLRGRNAPVALAVDRVLDIARVASPIPTGSAGADGQATGPAPPPIIGLGAGTVSGYAAAADAASGQDEGFSIVDLPRLLRRFLS